MGGVKGNSRQRVEVYQMSKSSNYLTQEGGRYIMHIRLILDGR